MRVLGVDCGSERTGYGIINSDGRRHRLLAAGVIAASPGWPLSRRVHAMFTGLRDLIVEHQPEAVAVEGVFGARYPRSALQLAHVRGVALLAAAEAGLEVEEYAPAQVKLSVTGHGRAVKGQMQRMVAALLGLEREIEPHDAADALAVAICHAASCAASARLTEFANRHL